MINFLRIKSLAFIGIVISCQISLANIETVNDSLNNKAEPIISGVHTLSVHVRDTILHDSVYQFFVHKLMLPVYYTPEKYGQRKYAGIYAGNMVLEPCGPYLNINYATDNFRSIFFGLNFEVNKSLESAEQALNDLGIKQQVNQGSIYIRDSILCNENIFAALYEVTDKDVRDSLRNSLNSDARNKPGIEYIKEIYIGYKGEVNLLKWKEFLYPLEIGENGICQINDSVQLHYIKGDINEVKGITFKVRSLEKAKQFLKENNLSASSSDQKIELDQFQIFGLNIYFTDKE